MTPEDREAQIRARLVTWDQSPQYPHAVYPIDDAPSDVRWLLDALTEARAQIARLVRDVEIQQALIARLDTAIRSYEEQEAACCPEDVGFAEYVTSLKATIAWLEAERDEAVNYRDQAAKLRLMDHAYGREGKRRAEAAESRLRAVVEALEALVAFKPFWRVFDHSGAMNATQLTDHQVYLSLMRDARTALQLAEADGAADRPPDGQGADERRDG